MWRCCKYSSVPLHVSVQHNIHLFPFFLPVYSHVHTYWCLPCLAKPMISTSRISMDETCEAVLNVCKHKCQEQPSDCQTTYSCAANPLCIFSMKWEHLSARWRKGLSSSRQRCTVVRMKPCKELPRRQSSKRDLLYMYIQDCRNSSQSTQLKQNQVMTRPDPLPQYSSSFYLILYIKYCICREARQSMQSVYNSILIHQYKVQCSAVLQSPSVLLGRNI